jgi:hypothetical protein
MFICCATAWHCSPSAHVFFIGLLGAVRQQTQKGNDPANSEAGDVVLMSEANQSTSLNHVYFVVIGSKLPWFASSTLTVFNRHSMCIVFGKFSFLKTYTQRGGGADSLLTRENEISILTF